MSVSTTVVLFLILSTAFSIKTVILSNFVNELYRVGFMTDSRLASTFATRTVSPLTFSDGPLLLEAFSSFSMHDLCTSDSVNSSTFLAGQLESSSFSHFGP